MVIPVYWPMERGITAFVIVSSNTCSYHLLECVGLMGMRCYMLEPLVPTTVGQKFRGLPYINQRTVTNCNSHRHLGPTLRRENHPSEIG